MNILISCNRNYLPYAKVCVQSVISNHENDNLRFFVMHLKSDSLIYTDFKKQFVKVNIIDVPIPDEIGKEIVLPRKYIPHVTVEAYFRLFIIDYLPKDVDRILYMDVDAVCNKDLSLIYDCDLRDCYVAGCKDYGFDLRPQLKEEVYGNLNIPLNRLYVNSGVLIFNLKKIREDFTQDDVMHWLKKIENKILFYDQDVINTLFYGNGIVELPKEMNMRPFHYSYNHHNDHYIKRHAYIIHYGSKPWHNKFSDMAGEVYWKYALMLGVEAEYERWKKENKRYKRLFFLLILYRRLKHNINIFRHLKMKGLTNYYLTEK